MGLDRGLGGQSTLFLMIVITLLIIVMMVLIIVMMFRPTWSDWSRRAPRLERFAQ